MLLVDEGTETLGQYQVAQILVMKQHLVLVVEQFLWAAAIVFECQFMGIHCTGGIERRRAEIHILVAGATQHHHEEVYLQVTISGASHPVFSEINLRVLSKRQFREFLIRARLLLKFPD